MSRSGDERTMAEKVQDWAHGHDESPFPPSHQPCRKCDGGLIRSGDYLGVLGTEQGGDWLAVSACLDCLGTGHSRSWWDPHLITVTLKFDIEPIRKSLAALAGAMEKARVSARDLFASHRDRQRRAFDRELEAQLFYGRD